MFFYMYGLIYSCRMLIVFVCSPFSYRSSSSDRPLCIFAALDSCTRKTQKRIGLIKGIRVGCIRLTESPRSTGVARNLCWGAWQPRRRDQDAEAVEGEGNGEGVSLLSRLEGLGECRKLPQRGPGPKTNFGIFRAWKNIPEPQMTDLSQICHIWHFCGIYLVTFTITKHKTFTYIFVPFAHLKRLCNFFCPLPLGGPRPPLATPMPRRWTGVKFNTDLFRKYL